MQLAKPALNLSMQECIGVGGSLEFHHAAHVRKPVLGGDGMSPRRRRDDAGGEQERLNEMTSCHDGSPGH
jgi:hypothetical protein